MSDTITAPARTGPGGGRRAPAPRRVLYIEANEDGTVGGSHQVLYDLARSVDRALYHPVVLFYQNNSYVGRLSELGVEVIVLESERDRERAIRRNGGRIAKAWEHLATVARRARFLREQRIDLIHVNNSPRACNDDWLPAARMLRIPCVVSVSGDASGPVGGWLAARLFRSFDHYLTISRYIHEAMLRAGIRADRTDLINPGIDTDAFRKRVQRTRAAVRAELGIPDDAVFALMVGNVRHWKGQHVVVEALARMPVSARAALFVAFAGATTPDDESYLAELHAAAEQAGIAERVRFLGSRPDVPDLLNAADLALHASVRPEPFGLVVVEAMSLGKAVVAANTGGPAEVVDTSSGVTFDPASPAQLADIITGLINDPERRAELGRGALERAEQFTVARYVAGVHRVYGKVLPVTAGS